MSKDQTGETPGAERTDDEASPEPSRQTRRFTRRSLFFGAAGGVAVGAAAGITGTAFAEAATPTVPSAAGVPESNDHTVAFYDGAHQAGIQTPQQGHCVYMTFDMSSTLASDLQVLLARWSGAIAQMTQGRSIGAVQPSQPDTVGADTGEALGLGASSLTVTVGFGPKLFDSRFGLADKKPKLLKPLPALPSDQLVAALSGGDLSLQACADDPQVAYHAIRDLARMAKGTATTRWTVIGFGPASAGANQPTPRNLMGFKDGTRNIREEADYERFVWVDDDDWTKGGSYQVVRKIQMNIENWDSDPIGDQQKVFGRTKQVGAPLSGHREFDTPDFAKSSGGTTAISATAHISLAAHEHNGGIKILRRGYNYTDGLNQFGLLDAGLLFIAYMNDPAYFSTIQSKLGAVDRLNEYIAHIGSGLFFVPRAPKAGTYIGQALFT